MSLKSKIKGFVKFLLSGPTKVVYANITTSSPSTLLNGKKIIVTGAARGLGAVMAKKFIENGADVLITGRSEPTLKLTASKLNCKYLAFDILRTETFDDFLSKAEMMLGGIDILVNNAAVSLHERTFFDVSLESFETQINTNLKGPFFLSQKFLSLLKCQKKEGKLLFISSETGLQCDHRPYSYTKAAINSMVQGLAYLFHTDGIRVNAICPGPFCSEMSGHKSEDNLRLDDRDRWYLPEELAEVALFLISDLSNCISGQVIACNNTRTYCPRER